MVQTLHTLDLDALMFEPARVTLPDGRGFELRELNGADLIAFGRQVGATAAQPAAQAPLYVAECLAGLATEPAAARLVLDEIPINQLLGLVNWVKTMEPPKFVIAPPEATAEVTLHGRTRAVLPLRLGTYRQAQALAGQTADEQAASQAPYALLASMLADTTPEEIAGLSYRHQVALNALLSEAMSQAAEGVQVPAPLPGKRSSGPRRSRSGK